MNTAETALDWHQDTELDGFEAASITTSQGFTATLVRATNNPPSARRAVLYIHGFTDYFFQTHMAAAYRAEGYAFYALDLHAYGRSLSEGERPNFCRHVQEYYPELEAAILAIKAAGAEQLVVNAHSTGGLITCLYAHEGNERRAIDALFLNSPFFDFPVARAERLLLNGAVKLGKLFPHFAVKRGLPSLYAKTIYREFRGEWDYNTRLKPPHGFPLYAGWVRAIVKGQERVQQGLNIACPVLVMHSARSLRALTWTDEATRADIVLDVEHMRRYSPGLGEEVTVEEIDGGLHDLVLSSAPVRRKLFATLFDWLEQALSATDSAQSTEDVSAR